MTADGQTYTLPKGACLCIGRGTGDVVFADATPAAGSAETEAGAQFYLFSAPGHTTCPTQLVLKGEGTVRALGDELTSNRRSLNQYIHEIGIRSC